MTQTLLRGRTLTFQRAPHAVDDLGSYLYETDGGLLLEKGLIVKAGAFDAVSAFAPEANIIDHRPFLLMAGFIDPHLHYPQMQVIASFGTRLIEWLNTYTFPEEMRFSDPKHASKIAERFFETLISHGTTTAAAYCTSNPISVNAFFEAAHKNNMCMIGGKVLMDRNAPDGLLDTPQSAYDDTMALAEKWHGNGRSLYAMTPRFAITSTPEQLDVTTALKAQLPDTYLQTHLGETPEEIAFATELYPNAKDYAGIYEDYGLLGPKTLLGHCIHLTEREIAAIASSGSVAVSCPTSNMFLGSGLFPRQHLQDNGVITALASDIGGGTSYSMLQTLDAYYKVLQLRREVLNPLASFDHITRGNAVALGLEDKIGTLAEQSEADIVVLDSCARPEMALRMKRAQSLTDELFVLQTMGDDRNIIETYVAGIPKKLKSRNAHS